MTLVDIALLSMIGFVILGIISDAIFQTRFVIRSKPENFIEFTWKDKYNINKETKHDL